ncbi:MAG: exodeoxyribonuclease VII small subunit [Lachnospiraceae bacterium]|nr:exodeoxyribonuclease VII small subunit [Lachnospiraceae bacterium]
MQKQQSKEDYRQEEQQLLNKCRAEEESRLEGELSLEEAFEQIEEVLAHLETEEITLEQSFQEYNRGMKLLQYCNETIDRVEKKVLQMNEDGGLDEF